VMKKQQRAMESEESAIFAIHVPSELTVGIRVVENLFL